MQDLIILGGTFDPIHNAHIAVIQELYRLFKTPVCLLPTGIQSYKSASIANIDQRLAMLKIITAKYPAYLDLTEINHPDLSYTYKTLLLLKQKLPNDSRLFFTIGLDSLLSLHTWQNYSQIMQLTNIIVAPRPGYQLTDLAKEIRDLLHDNLQSLTPNIIQQLPNYGKFYILDNIEVDVSSTKIRQLLKHQQDVSALLPPEINKFIQENKIYL